MTEEKYKEGKDIQDRIKQLEILHAYLSAFFKYQPFSFKIEYSLLGESRYMPFYNINGKHETMVTVPYEENDTQYVLDCITKRMDELKKQFAEL